MDEDCVGTMAWYYCRTEKEIEEKVQKVLLIICDLILENRPY